MSITISILKTLNTKDKNIKFDENYLEERYIKEKRSLIFKANIDVYPKCCPSVVVQKI